ncbi:MAG: metallophosphoesterase [Melioribacteraceae bacterium]
MKILMISDIHLRDSGSRFRIDNYRETQFKKLEWCLKLGVEKKCDLMLQAGDLFDSVRASNWLISDTINLFKKSKLNILAVSGNHDQRHLDRSLVNTPIKVVESADVIKLLEAIPSSYENVDIYGCHWGDTIPEIIDKNKFNILVIHKMVIRDEDEKIWCGQTGHITARVLLSKNKFDVILSADNHKYFVHEYNGKTLLNMGSLTRLNISQIDYIPKIAVFDTDTKTYELFEIPCEHSSISFNLEEVLKNKDKKETSEQIKEYIDILSADSGAKEFSFVDNLNNFILKNEIRQSVQDIIKSTLEVK